MPVATPKPMHNGGLGLACRFVEAHNQYRYTLEVMGPGYAVAHRVVMARLWLVIRVLAAVFLGVGIVLLATEARAGGVILLLIGGWLLLVPRIVRSFTTRSLRASPAYGRDVEWTVSTEGVVLSSDGLDSPMPWKSFSQVVDTEAGVLLVRPGSFYWLPTDHFVEEDGHRVAAELASMADVKFSRHS